MLIKRKNDQCGRKEETYTKRRMGERRTDHKTETIVGAKETTQGYNRLSSWIEYEIERNTMSNASPTGSHDNSPHLLQEI